MDLEARLFTTSLNRGSGQAANKATTFNTDVNWLDFLLGNTIDTYEHLSIFSCQKKPSCPHGGNTDIFLCKCWYSQSVKKTWAALYLAEWGSLKSEMRVCTDWGEAQAEVAL